MGIETKVNKPAAWDGHVLTCDEGFSFKEVGMGWQWQETGAEGWSEITYDTFQAIREEFGTIDLAIPL